MSRRYPQIDRLLLLLHAHAYINMHSSGDHVNGKVSFLFYIYETHSDMRLLKLIRHLFVSVNMPCA